MDYDEDTQTFDFFNLNSQEINKKKLIFSYSPKYSLTTFTYKNFK